MVTHITISFQLQKCNLEPVLLKKMQKPNMEQIAARRLDGNITGED